ncbi:MAG: glycoside hydrolase domain-containing protein [Opitutaceae bacterium]
MHTPSCHGLSAETTPHGVGDWPESFGNHRVRTLAEKKTDAVWLHIPWRRRDANPEAKEIIVIDAATGQRVKNVMRVDIRRESGDLLFQPVTVPGEYYVYYLPFTNSAEQWYSPSISYPMPTNLADDAWAAACQPLGERIIAGDTAGLPTANVLEIQAINEFHRFDPMEVIATEAEMQSLCHANAGKSFLLFPEDRRYPIRMTNDLPQRWIEAGPNDRFHGEACRGECYVFQIGVYAIGQDLDNLRVSFGSLDHGRHSIPAENMRCFNLGGSDWLGRPFSKETSVRKGRVQPLWIGIQVPRDATPGTYEGALAVAPENAPETTVKLSLDVSGKTLADAGDSELWRHSRLRWLDSKIGLDDEVVAPFTPIAVTGRTLGVLGRRARIADGGLFDSIQSRFGYSVDHTDSPPREILAGPMRFIAETASGPLAWIHGPPRAVSQTSGAAAWESTSEAPNLTLQCQAKMECDGHVNFRLTLRAANAMEIKDLCLEIPLRRDVAAYMMGLGCKGGRRPAEWHWKWDKNRANNQLWIGDVNAGISCKLKNVTDRWDLYNLQKSGTYKDWSNDGRGGCDVDERGDHVLVRAYTGTRHLAAGEELHFNFGLLITPFRTLDKQHWQWRYFHTGGNAVANKNPPVKQAADNGCTIINIHQGNSLNPYINYPFLTIEQLSAYISEAHARGVKVKLYYTIRELSNYAPEFWALRSLGSEIHASGPGFRLADQFTGGKSSAPNRPTGSSWLCEHAVTDYVPAWHQPLGNGHCDAAVATTGLSRWHNYYLEGLAWLVKNVGVDGLYLDGIGYDRETMKRVRKVLDRAKPGCLLDFHSGNNFDPNYGLNNCANQYMELLPYINSLWFGEGFNYNAPPDYWLVEICGIPYGLFGEMLQDGGNRWRGMVYGMTGRLGWCNGNADPRPLWKLWDAFGIAQARMIGYWDPACPIKTGRQDVLATVYVNHGKTLVAIASWAPQPVTCTLEIDWESLKLDPAKTTLSAGEVTDFQPAAEFRPVDEIPLQPGRGWLLMLQRIMILLMLATLPATAAELEFSGVLGQSEPQGNTPIPGPGTSSATDDGKGGVWFVANGAVYRMDASGRDLRKTSLHSVAQLLGDGKDIFCVAQRTIGQLRTTGENDVDIRPIVTLDRAYENVAVAPASTHQRFAKSGKFFALDAKRKKVFAWNAQGNPLGAVLDLAPTKVSGDFETVGVMPDSGYLLVATWWPDNRVYRYDMDGAQARSGIWPAGGWCKYLLLSDGHIWGVHSRAVRYDDALEGLSRTVVGDDKDARANGIAADGKGGYYLSTTQGLKHYPAGSLDRCARRIGSCGAPVALALNRRGKIIASLGNQLLALNLDDEPDAPFGNTGDEPWHVGGNWTSTGCAIVADGDAFLILDRNLRTLWRFSPQIERWLERDKRMVRLNQTFTAPTDFAYAGDTLVFVDNGKLSVPNDVNEPLARVDAFGPDELVVAGGDFVALLRAGKTVWRVPAPVKDIAVIGDYLAVAGDELRLFDKNGKVVFRSPNALSALAAAGQWLIGTDPAGGRILRFKLK